MSGCPCLPRVISRREIVLKGAGAAAVIGHVSLSDRALAEVASLEKFEMVKSDEEWRRELTSEQYTAIPVVQARPKC